MGCRCSMPTCDCAHISKATKSIHRAHRWRYHRHLSLQEKEEIAVYGGLSFVHRTYVRCQNDTNDSS